MQTFCEFVRVPFAAIASVLLVGYFVGVFACDVVWWIVDSFAPLWYAL